MPSLEGLPLADAIGILKAIGFPEPLYEMVHDEKPAGTVLTQTIRKDAVVPVDTVVELTVSLGPEATEPPTDPPTEPQPVTKDVEIDVSSFIEADETFLEIRRDGVSVYSNTVGADVSTITLKDQSGLGKVEYAIYVNDALVGSEEVDF